jgi:hypothetical protein
MGLVGAAEGRKIGPDGPPKSFRRRQPTGRLVPPARTVVDSGATELAARQRCQGHLFALVRKRMHEHEYRGGGGEGARICHNHGNSEMPRARLSAGPNLPEQLSVDGPRANHGRASTRRPAIP